jgi:asparagine synthase (glutamine-hydrolysing)
MCGIAGIALTERERELSPSFLDRMAGTMRHRGPDDQGVFQAPGVGITMRRLSIIDLAGGHQPIANEDGTAVIVLNGEIYNYRELREDLIAKGHQFRTHSDTETILHLYEEKGPECVSHLRGMFAFAIWDARRELLLLARDRFGIKPLYIAESDWGLAFASELKVLVAAGLTRREISLPALDAYLQLGYMPAPLTPFSDVRKLEPGHVLLWRRGRPAEEKRYWEVPSRVESPPPDVEERVRAWIDESVRAHLVSDVPVAAFLSGGLDSSAVVASMALQNGCPHAFTARYTGSGAAAADETPLARELARRYGAELSVVTVEPRITEIIEPITWALDEPHADDSAIPTWLMCEAVGREYKVALTGLGGDELFGGYRRHLGMALGRYYQAVPAALRRPISFLADQVREPAGGALTINRLKRFLRASGDGGAELFLSYLTRVPDSTRAELMPALDRTSSSGAALSRMQDLLDQSGMRPGLSTALFLDFKTFLPDDALALSDRLSMAHSLELRVPLVDHELVEHVFPLPDRLKVNGLRPKALLRRALEPRLPAAHFRAPKRGFVGPTAAWLRNELRPLLLDELASDRTRRLGYFTPATVERFIREHETRKHNWEGVLWALTCFSVWHRLYVEAPASDGLAAREAGLLAVTG